MATRRGLVITAAAAVVVVGAAVTATVVVTDRSGPTMSDAEARQLVVSALPSPESVQGLPPQPLNETDFGERVSEYVNVETGADLTSSLVCGATTPAGPVQATGARVKASETFFTPSAYTTLPGSRDTGGQGLVVSATAFTADSINAVMAELADKVTRCTSTQDDSVVYTVPIPPGGPDPGPPLVGEFRDGAPTPEGSIDLGIRDRIAWRGQLPKSKAPNSMALQTTCILDRVNLVVTSSCGVATESPRADEIATLGAGRMLDNLQ